jgi:hypothetical protein
MTDLPLEIIDHILTFANASSLYELGQVSHMLRSLSQKQLQKQHIQHASLRLWMHQPGTMAHTPMDFTQPICQSSSDQVTAEFKYLNQPLPIDPKKPVFIDGCTVIFSTRKHYGLTYPNPIMMQPGDDALVEKQGQWTLYGEFKDAAFTPLRLSCDTRLFNPILLDAMLRQQTIRLQERILLKRQLHARSTMALIDPKTTTSAKDSCAASKPLDLPCTPLLSS